MTRFSVFIATTLDGFIARSDGRIDFLSVVEREGEDYGYARFFDSIDTLVIGLAENVLTDLTLSVLPIMIGTGVSLFGDLGHDVKLDLVRSQSFESGLVQLEYVPRR